jgi:hypothetical protein
VGFGNATTSHVPTAPNPPLTRLGMRDYTALRNVRRHADLTLRALSRRPGEDARRTKGRRMIKVIGAGLPRTGTRSLKAALVMRT